MIEQQWRRAKGEHFAKSANTSNSAEVQAGFMSEDPYAVQHYDGVWRVLQIRYVTNMEVQAGVQPIWSEWKDVPVEAEKPKTSEIHFPAGN